MLIIEQYLQVPSVDIMSLLLMADPDEKMVRVYIKDAALFVAVDDDKTVGVVVITGDQDNFELKNIAVDKSFQGQGIAKILIEHSFSYVKSQQGRSMIVGTGNSSLGQLALYQKCGFRLSHIIPNFFASYQPEIIENGIRCVDMVVLKIDL